MRAQLVPLLAAAVAAAALNLLWQSLDYGFPDDLAAPAQHDQVGDQTSGLAWFVHITDLHISQFSAEDRTRQLLQLVGELRRHVRPAAVVVTGDLTDAKTEDHVGSGQLRAEWEQYREVVEAMGPDTPWLDIRGNHDNFDVPYPEHGKNYFRTHSVQGRAGNLGSYLVNVESNGVNLGFLAVDATLQPGPRRPFNFVGALNQNQLDHLSRLANKSRHEAQATVMFGHYPTSTIVSHQPGVRAVLGSGLVYLCGHLHNLHGLAGGPMVVRHKNGLREAELTDWKDNRHFRLVAVDQGLLAWRDLAHSAAGAHWPAVLVTWPPSAAAAHRAGDREPLYLAASATHVRVLAWSHVPVTRVTATLLATGQLLELRRSEARPELWTCAWQLQPDGEGELEVRAEDEWGGVTVTRHAYSAGAGQQRAWTLPRLGQLVIMGDMIAFFQLTFSLLTLASVSSLSLARLQPGTPLPLLGLLLHPVSALDSLYYPLVLAPLYLTLGPWFIGHVLSDSVGVVFCWGTVLVGVPGPAYLPTATTWLYGSYHLATAHLPLTLATAALLRAKQACSRAALMAAHGAMLLIVLKQAWLVRAFYQAYGLMAVILGPFRSGYLVLSLGLWIKAARSGADENQTVKRYRDAL